MKKRSSCNALLFFVPFFFLPLFQIPANPARGLPLIGRLDNRDAVFKQYVGDVDAARRSLFRYGISLEELSNHITIYSYVAMNEDEILGLAARCNIPYGSIASINRLSHPDDFQGGVLLLLPSMPGLFIPEIPKSDLELLLASSREGGITVNVNGEKFRFLPGTDFNSTERIFFLNRGFRFPLRNYRLTSPYGPRINPVTGREGHHHGIDLAAPEGTPVYAVREGVVSAAGIDPILGTYVIITHQNNWSSIYGHLSSTETSLNQVVKSGTMIGRVGSTGQSTGPHLHFELRQNGQSRDPGKLLGIFRTPNQ